MSNIILFNGASSSGKSTLIKELIKKLDSPYFYYSSDKLLDAKILPEVDKSNNNNQDSWNIIRPKFFDGFHRSIRSFADAGNDIIVEHIIESMEWFDQLVELLQHHKVYYIGLFCPIEILEEREIDRGNLESGIHSWGSYDLELDTYKQSIDENIDMIIKLLKSNKNSEFPIPQNRYL